MFTKKEKNLLFDALRNAEDYQDGLADAWHNRGPEAEQAFEKSRQYKALRQKLSDKINRPMKTKWEVIMEEGELVNVSEIKKRFEKGSQK